MEALGMIETIGLTCAIEGADVMLKTANVSLVCKRKSTAGLVAIFITGDVGAVKASVESGAAAVQKIRQEGLVSSHVIPRPIAEMYRVLEMPNPEGQENSEDQEKSEKSDQPLIPTEKTVDESEKEDSRTICTKDARKEKALEVPIHSCSMDMENPTKENFDHYIEQAGIRAGIALFDKIAVAKLRKLARTYDGIKLAGRAISEANKETLVQTLRGYYEGRQ